MKLTEEELNELTRKYYPSNSTVIKQEIKQWAKENGIEITLTVQK